MKKHINITDYANQITSALPRGILLNTQADKFNSMVIGWGHLGTLWGKPTFVVYVRQSRFTKEQLDKTGVFTISSFLEKGDPTIFKICGTRSGRDVDKVSAASLTLEEAEVNGVPGVKEYPLTLECKVLYKQDQVVQDIPVDIVEKFYPEEEVFPGERGVDFHTMYVGEIVSSYIIE